MRTDVRRPVLDTRLGHRDINTTRIYLRLTSEDVMREVAKRQFYLNKPARDGQLRREKGFPQPSEDI